MEGGERLRGREEGEEGAISMMSIDLTTTHLFSNRRLNSNRDNSCNDTAIESRSKLGRFVWSVH